MLEYTRADVKVLREACTKFRTLIKTATTVPGAKSPPIDVFSHVTLASSAMQIIRQLTMSEEHDLRLQDGDQLKGNLKAGVWSRADNGQIIDAEDIAESKFVKSQLPQPPPRSYGRYINHSLKSIMWLEWVGKTLGRRLQHARNGGEYKIPNTNFYTDGHDISTGKIFDFYGCRWHGHGCIPSRHVRDPHTRFNMEQLHSMTKLREKKIQDTGLIHETIWECEWDRMVKSDDDLKLFVENFDVPPPLRIRDALYGGRTEPIRLYYDCDPDEEMRYLDFCVKDNFSN